MSADCVVMSPRARGRQCLIADRSTRVLPRWVTEHRAGSLLKFVIDEFTTAFTEVAIKPICPGL